MPDHTVPPFSPVPDAPDWEAFLRRHVGAGVAEIELAGVRPADRLLVLTEHTAYLLVIRPDGDADLTTNRKDRPSGRVRIHGCTFGASSSIKPNHLFCGGNLEFRHGDQREIYTTTRIRALQLTQGTSG